MTDEFITKNCTQCKDCYLIASHMYGCGHMPYKGKWIAEIEVCPRIATMKDGAKVEVSAC